MFSKKEMLEIQSMIERTQRKTECEEIMMIESLDRMTFTDVS